MKRTIIKIISIITFIIIIGNCYKPLFYFTERNTIEMVINPLMLAGLYYYKITSKGTMTICFGTINDYDTNISSPSFQIT